jgi:hypothetical protein
VSGKNSFSSIQMVQVLLSTSISYSSSPCQGQKESGPVTHIEYRFFTFLTQLQSLLVKYALDVSSSSTWRKGHVDY